MSKHKLQLSLVALLGFFIRIYYAHLDPFLHSWDEKFHALVARNMMDNPWVPMLYKTPLGPYDPYSWCCNHIWLHKPPLFMWQMALSMKIFGASEYSMRYPSALMGVIGLLVIYRITILLTTDHITAMLSAILMCFSHFQLELTSGYYGMDHNDMAFGFYFLLSAWALAEYLCSKRIHWAMAVGVFAGLAVLNKWMLGMIIFFPWSVWALRKFIVYRRPSHFLHLLLGVGISFMVFVPWQYYIMREWSDIALFETQFSSRHIFEVVEGHDANVFFYLMNMPVYWGLFLFAFIPLAYYLIAKGQYKVRKNIQIVLSMLLLFILVFFSILVRTKLPNYMYIAIPIGAIYIAIGLSYTLSQIRNIPLRNFLIVIAAALMLRPALSYRYHHREDRDQRIQQTERYKNIKQEIPDGYQVILNCDANEGIGLMFYNPDITAYHWTLDEHTIDSLADAQVEVASFDSRFHYELPAYILEYPGIFIF